MAVVTRTMLLLLAVCALVLPSTRGAHAQAKQTSPLKQAAMLIDANTGKVLHEQFADAPRYPASLTKMMTLYLVFSEIEAGRLDFNTKIKVSERAAGMAPSKLDLDAGDEIAVIDAVKALITKSANDMAVALAEHIGGSEYAFARLMTERARQIGMASSTFKNASGLPDSGQITTARDMVTLGIRLQEDFPKHYRLFSITSFTYRGKTYRSHNTLMRGFAGMDGIKTGYTRASGFNLVSSVRADGKHVVGAVFGGKTASTRNAHMRSLLYTALQKASTEKTRTTSPQANARPRPAAKPAAAPTDAAWAAETKQSPAPKPAKPPVKVAANVPPPAPVPVPTPAPRLKRDEIAKVLANEAPAPTGETPATAVSAAPVAPPPRLDLEALRAAMSETHDGQEGSEPVRTLQASSAGPQDIAGLIRNSLVEGTPEAPARMVAVSDPVPASQARPPSTLDSQASALLTFAGPAYADTPKDGSRLPPGNPPSHLKGPISPPQLPAAPVGTGFEIQIGAYGSQNEAQTKLEAVRSRATGLLQGHGGVTMPVQRADRQMFRARFVNFSEDAASSTCLELRRLAIDCFVMKAE